jgi:transcriptional regulator with XRE-family HTH domain
VTTTADDDPGRLDASPIAEGEHWVPQLGKIIRESRRGRFTVERLAARAGVSGGLISQLERGIGNPSFMTLVRLAGALDLPLSAFFSGADVDPSALIVRLAERRRLEIPSDGIVHELLVPPTQQKLGVIKTILPPGFSNEDQPVVHPGEEVLIVIRGTLRGNVGDQPFVLNEGDSITFDSSIPHGLTNAGKKPVELLGISTPPFAGGEH